MKKIVKKELGSLLVDDKIITEEQLAKGVELQKKSGALLGECLIKLGYVTEDDITNAIMVQYGFPYLPLENYEIDIRVLEMVSEETARQHSIMPVDIIGNIFTVAMANPLEGQIICELEKKTGKKIEVFISTPTEINKSIESTYKRLRRRGNGQVT